MPKIRKKTSNRQTIRKQYSAVKKVKDHKKKIKKQAKKLSKIGITPKKLKKQPGIPNLYPYKEEMLDALERKDKINEQLQDQLNLLKAAKKQIGHGTSLHDYAQSVNAKVMQFEEENAGTLSKAELDVATDLMVKNGEIDDPNMRQMGQSRRAYYKELKKVIEAADVLVQVLDARDPLGCRNQEVELQATSQGKKVLLVLNKIDLVPPQNARLWQRYLRRDFPCIPFKATQQNQNANYATGASLHKKSMMDKPEMVSKMTSASTSVGTENLMNVLKNYARVEGEKNIKQMITVGVIGFPNVGKSSLINSLKRSKAAATGNTPGITKAMQEIQLDKNIVLIDSPGVVLSTQDQADSLVLRSAIRVEDIVDPLRPVEALLNRIDHQQLLAHYRIGVWKSVDEFLGQVARKRGYLQQGGIANFDQAARQVIRDFVNGKLVYHTNPPDFDDNVGDSDDGEMGDQEMS